MKKAILLSLVISASLFSSSSFAFGTCKFVITGPFSVEKVCDNTPPTAVPEIDAAGSGIAFALVGGLVLAYRERRLSKKSN